MDQTQRLPDLGGVSSETKRILKRNLKAEEPVVGFDEKGIPIYAATAQLFTLSLCHWTVNDIAKLLKAVEGTWRETKRTNTLLKGILQELCKREHPSTRIVDDD